MELHKEIQQFLLISRNLVGCYGPPIDLSKPKHPPKPYHCLSAQQITTY